MVVNYLRLKETFGERIKEDEPMSLHTTFKVGGPARLYFEAQNNEELIQAVRLCQKNKFPYFVLGGGSNLLVSDDGFRGLVIRNKSKNIKILIYQGTVKNSEKKIKKLLLEVDSGVLSNTLVRYCVEEGLAGLENFLGLPGTVGGAIYINAHYRGDFMGDHLEKARLLTPEGEIKEVDNSYFNFDYDYSVLQKTGDVLINAIFALTGGDKETLWKAAHETLEWRHKNHHYDFPSAGSIFQNIKKSDAMRIGTPNFTQSAGFLIEASGLKGMTKGDAQISPDHANFIVNKGGARACDVLELINLAKKRVREKFGIKLKEEIVLLGES